MSLRSTHDAAEGYDTALRDTIAAAKLAIAMREMGGCSQQDVQQLFRNELAHRWQGRVERGELPISHSAETVAVLADALEFLINTPEPAEVV